MAAVVQATQEAALKGPASPIEVYNCNLHVLDPVQVSQQATCITIEDLGDDSQNRLILLNLVSFCGE